MSEVSGAKQASSVYDAVSESVASKFEADENTPPMTINPAKIRGVLGFDMPKTTMVELLGNVEFPLCEDCGWNPEDAQDNVDDLHVNSPFWRTDIEIAEDVIEEIGRLYGYEKLPQDLPQRTVRATSKNPRLELKARIRDVLSRAGSNELLTYSFVHEKVLTRAGQDSTQAFRLSNALSPELQYYRLSVLPSLLDKVHANIKAGHDEFVIYEIGKGHNRRYHANDDGGLPKELEFVDAVYASKKNHEGSPYFYMRSLVDMLCKELGFEVVYKTIAELLDFPVTAPFNQARSALVETKEGVFIGMIGELRQAVLKNFKMPEYSAAMTLDFEGLLQAYESSSAAYKPLSRYPSVTQDISLKVAADTPYATVFDIANQALHSAVADSLHFELRGLGVYQPEDSAHKTVTLRIKATSAEKTLKDADVSHLLDAIADSAAQKIDAKRA